MTQDTSDNGGRDEEEKSYQIQSDHSTLAIANQNIFSTPHVHARNKASSQSILIPVVTPPENNVPSDPIRPPGIPNKGANSDDHQGCIDMSIDDTVDDMVPKRKKVIIDIDSDDDTVEDSGTTIDDNKNEELRKNRVPDSVD